jgi:hypothetical protein
MNEPIMLSFTKGLMNPFVQNQILIIKTFEIIFILFIFPFWQLVASILHHHVIINVESMFILKCEHVCLFQMKNNQNFKSY